MPENPPHESALKQSPLATNAETIEAAAKWTETQLERARQIALPESVDATNFGANIITKLRTFARAKRGKVTAAVAVGASVVSINPTLRENASLLESWTTSIVAAKLEDTFGSPPHIDMHTASLWRSYEFMNADYGMNDGFYRATRYGWPGPTWWNISAGNALLDLSLADKSHEDEYTQHFDHLMTTLNVNRGSPAPGLPDGLFPDDALVHNKSFGMDDDDNAWDALAKLRAGGEDAVSDAEATYKLLMTQRDMRDGGGIYWEVQIPGVTNYHEHDLAAVSNYTVVQLATELYGATGEQKYLDEAISLFNWAEVHLVDPKTNLADDHVVFEGPMTEGARRKWTYGQGARVGAMTGLAEAKPGAYSLNTALKIADISLVHFKYCDYFGNPAFRAVYFRNLLYLGAQLKKAHNPKAEAFIQRVQAAMANAVNNLPKQPTTLIHTAGSVAIKAEYAMPESKYIDLFPSSSPTGSSYNTAAKHPLPVVYNGGLAIGQAALFSIKP